MNIDDIDFEEWRNVIAYAEDDGGVFYRCDDDDGEEMYYHVNRHLYLSNDSLIVVVEGEASTYRKETRLIALIVKGESIRMLDERCRVHDVSEVLEQCLLCFVRSHKEDNVFGITV